VVYSADQDVDGVEELFSALVAEGGPPVRISGSLFPDGDIISGTNVPGDGVAFTGDRVVYLVYRPVGPEMNVVSLDGSAAPEHVVQLPSGRRFVSILVASGGQHIVYKATRDGTNAWDLFSVPMSGGSSVQFNAAGVLASGEQITPDGSRIVYIAARQVYAAPIEGGPSVPLGPIARTDSPAFSITPGGGRVVVHSDPALSQQKELFTVPIEGGPFVQLTPPVSGRRALDFLITPDGASVVYRGNYEVETRADLFQVPIQGGPSVRLNQWWGWEGSVDPYYAIGGEHGDRVVYVANAEDVTKRVYSVSRLGQADQVRLTPRGVPTARRSRSTAST
jgi:Tol biopolymer transport system component